MRTLLSLLTLQTALLFLSTTTAATKCYYNDGTEAEAEMQPCFPSKSVSACCSTNKNGNLANDVCLHNGLCIAQVAQYSGMIFQNGCTDKSWESPDCPRICGTSLAQNSGIYILPCPQRGVGYWCCSANGTECCDDAFRMNMGSLVISPEMSLSGAGSASTTGTGTGTGTGTRTANPDAKATTTTTATTTASITVTATSNPGSCALGGGSAECPKSNTTAVGAGLGISLGACLVGAVAALFFQRRAHQKKLKEFNALHASQMMQFGNGGRSPHPTSRAMAELPLRADKVYEIGDGRRE